MEEKSELIKVWLALAEEKLEVARELLELCLRACFKSYVHTRDMRLTRPQLGCVPDGAT